jgi:hypothetical protein
MRPRDVLVQHLDLTEILGNGNTALGKYFDSLATLDKVITQGSSVAPFIAQNLKNSRAYLIAAQMTAPINTLAGTMHDQSTIGEDYVPPRPCGFAVLEEPITYTELRGRNQIVHAVSWGPIADQQGNSGWLMVSYNDMQRHPDDIAVLVDDTVIRRLLGRWHGIGVYFVSRGMRVGPKVLQPSEDQIMEVAADGDTAYPSLNPCRVFAALWGLLNDTITTHTTEGADRAVSRLAARHQLPTEITVITLRREAHSVQNPGSGSPLMERIWVDGFRRRYWCGSGTDRHQEWRNIGGHWRGPEDASVVDRPKVNTLVR